MARLSVLIAVLLTLVTVTGAVGVCTYYNASIPSASVEYRGDSYEVNNSYAGLGLKIWYSLFPYLSVVGGFSFNPSYPVDDIGERIIDVKTEYSIIFVGGGVSTGWRFGKFYPYGLCEIGLYHHKLKITNPDYPLFSVTDSSSDFGVRFGGGIQIALWDPLGIDVCPTYSIIQADKGSDSLLDIRIGFTLQF